MRWHLKGQWLGFRLVNKTTDGSMQATIQRQVFRTVFGLATFSSEFMNL